MKNNPRFGFAIEYVTDIKAAEQFYVDVLGLEVERTHPSFVQFSNFAIASDEPLGGKREVELYWLVDDADALYADLSKRAEVTLPLQQKPFGKVFGIRGPTGQPRFLLQLAQARPSQTVR